MCLFTFGFTFKLDWSWRLVIFCCMVLLLPWLFVSHCGLFACVGVILMYKNCFRMLKLWTDGFEYWENDDSMDVAYSVLQGLRLL